MSLTIALSLAALTLLFVGLPQASGGITIQDGAKQATVAIERDDNRSFFWVTINGQGPFKLSFDTGAVSILNLPVAQALGLDLKEGEREEGAGANTQRSWKTMVGRANLGGVTLKDHEFLVLELDPIKDAIGFQRLDGLLGRQLFERFVVHIDYDAKSLSFFEPGTVPAQYLTGTQIPFEFIGPQLPSVQLEIDGLKARFALDTGDRFPITFFTPFADRNGLRKKYSPIVSTITGQGVGGPLPADVARLGSVKTAGFEAKNVLARMISLKSGVFASDIAAGTLGSGFLRRFNITYDYGAKRMYWTPNKDFQSDDVYDRAGVWLVKTPKGLEVRAVTAKSGADDAGIKTGDVVLAVDDQQWSSLVLSALRQRLAERAPGERVVFRIAPAAGGAERDVTITLRNLI